MSKNWVKDIAEMHTKFGVNEKVREFDGEKLKKFLEFRVNFLQEELDELKKATDGEDMVDALIDLCVVAIGTLDAFDVDAYKAWNTVHRANMKKEVGIKESRPNPLGLPDLIKPKGWRSPSHKKNHGLFTKIDSKN
jgi:predicted HAD superfamily Cof-like phosphohydrolase